MKPLLFFYKGFFIPEGIEVNGNFVSEKEGAIAGIINGDVKVAAKLIIERKGVINGDLHATDVIVKGKVNGNIYCSGKITTLKDALVSGNVFAAEAHVDKGSIVKGVIAHINQKENPEVAGNTENETGHQSTVSEITDFSPDEPPQNWF